MTDPDAEAAEKKAENVRLFQEVFGQAVPHNRALGLELVDLETNGQALIRLPYAKQLVGNPATGVLHGGPITTLLDATCGAAIITSMDPPRPIATLDLRIDYLGPATPGEAVLCRAVCTKVTRQVAFVRATAFHTEDAPIATAAGSFMIFGGRKSVMLQNMPESKAP